MNLLLRPLNDINDPTWSVIISLLILLFGVGFYVIYILKISYMELNDGSDDTPESEELLQFPSDQHR